MRLIKFRWWDDSRGKMCYPETIINGCENAYLMQFTGLHDKNGKEIFEGDVVKYLGLEVSNGKQIYPERRMVITWDYYDLSRLMNIIGNSKARQAEVIGNIYQNPELIECDA